MKQMTAEQSHGGRVGDAFASLSKGRGFEVGKIKELRKGPTFIFNCRR